MNWLERLMAKVSSVFTIDPPKSKTSDSSCCEPGQSCESDRERYEISEEVIIEEGPKKKKKKPTKKKSTKKRISQKTDETTFNNF